MKWPIKKFAEHHIKDGGLDVDTFVCSTIYYLVPHVTMAGNLLTQKGWKHSLLKLSLFSCRLQKCFLPNVTGGLAQVWMNYLLYPPFQYFDNTWHFANCFPMVNLKIVWFNYIWKYIKHKQSEPSEISRSRKISWDFALDFVSKHLENRDRERKNLDLVSKNEIRKAKISISSRKTR